MKLSLAYFGAPYFSGRLLEKIITDKNLPIEVALVVSQPDKPVGKKRILTPTPVSQVAKKYKVDIIDNIARYKQYVTQTDLALVYAYGQIIPADLLSLPKYGFWNLHPSLLPLYRGPSPIAYPLILGDAKTGVTLIQMDGLVDHGPIINQKSLPILPCDKRPDLEVKLTDMACEVLKTATEKLLASRFIKLHKQDHKKATYTRMLKKEDGFIPLTVLKKALNGLSINHDELPSIVKEYSDEYPHSIESCPPADKLIFNYFRGLSPWPGIWTLIQIKNVPKRLKITAIKFVDNRLKIEKVQLEGKKEVDLATFNQAYKVF